MAADLDLSAATTLTRSRGVEAVKVDATDPKQVAAVVLDADVIVNCTSYHLGVELLRNAIDAGVDYVDLGGLYNTPKQMRLHDRARRAGVTAVLGCGATPGLTNVMAALARDALDEVHEVDISFASHRNLAPSPGLLDTILDEFRPGVARFFWEDGELVPVAPFGGEARVRFPPPLGLQRVFVVPHSETHTLPQSFPTLRRVTVRGTWRPEHMQTLKSLSELGLTSDRPIQVNGKDVIPLEVLRTVLLRQNPAADGPCAFFLHVSVSGIVAGGAARLALVAAHPLDWGDAATARMTAVPAAIAAELLAEGGGATPGVMAADSAFDASDFRRRVGEEGVSIRRVPAGKGRAGQNRAGKGQAVTDRQ